VGGSCHDGACSEHRSRFAYLLVYRD
jgi:hypothetical protein